MIESFVNGFTAEIEIFIEFLPRLLIAFVIASIIYGIGKIAGSSLIKLLAKSSVPKTYYSYFQKLINVTAVFIGFIVFLNLIGYNTFAASLLAGGGLTAVMLGFAFKDIGENFLAGFFLAFSRPFNENDLIETDGITGRVKAIEIRHTHLRTADGCDVFIPSAQLFSKPLHNFTLDGMRRGAFTVGIDYKDDSTRATEILLNSIKSIKGILLSPSPSAQIKEFNADYVVIQVSFWINTNDQEAGLSIVRTKAMDTCRVALHNNDYTISSDVTTAIEMHPLDVKISDGKN